MAGTGFGDFARAPPDNIQCCYGFVGKVIERLLCGDFTAVDVTKVGSDRIAVYDDVLRRALWSGEAQKQEVLMVLQDCFRVVSSDDGLEFKSLLQSKVRLPPSFVASFITLSCPSLPQMQTHQMGTARGNSWLYFGLAVSQAEDKQFRVSDAHLADAWTMACTSF